MKTKDFIKMLQKEDPSGESYIRINGEPVWFVEGKPGYWDGPYNYLEISENGKYTWVQSTKGDKIDVHTMDMMGFAERFNGNWEEIKDHIRVEYDYLDDGQRERQFIEKAKQECENFSEMIRDIKENYKK